jgi:hypothetical protein
MPDSDEMAHLRKLLNSNLIRERQAGVAAARDLLAAGLQREEVRALLAAVAEEDLIDLVRDDARQALSADDARSAPPKPADYIFGAVCPNGHTSYYDKRAVCPSNGTYMHRLVRRDEVQVDEVRLTCQEKTCRAEFYVVVPCEGY